MVLYIAWFITSNRHLYNFLTSSLQIHFSPFCRASNHAPDIAAMPREICESFIYGFGRTEFHESFNGSFKRTTNQSEGISLVSS
jgi:hypothetical protein